MTQNAALMPPIPVNALTTSWAAAVVTAGGTVSPAQATLTSWTLNALTASGDLANLDDLIVYTAENTQQTLISWKKRLAGSVGGGAPAFTANAGYVFNGTSDWLHTGFTPSSSATVMTGSDQSIGVYERTNFIAGGVYAAGSVVNSTTEGLRVNPGVANLGGAISGQANSAVFTSGLLGTSLGLSFVSRSAAPVFGTWRNGVSAGTGSPGTSGTVLSTKEVYAGCFNNNGTAAGFRNCSLGFVALGNSALAASPTFYQIMQQYMASKGAQV